jgi:uncharacterized protein (TIRG00374 family)
VARSAWRLRGEPRRALLVVVSFAISAACLVYVLNRISLRDMVDSLRAADYAWVIPSTLLTIGTAWLRGVRWRALFAAPGAITTGQAFAASSVGLMFNNLLPSRAGDVVRVFSLRRATGVSAVEIGATVVVERVLDIFVLGLIGLALWPWLPDRPWVQVLGAVCLGVVLACAAGLALLLALRSPLRSLVLRVLRRLPGLRNRAGHLQQALGAGIAVLGRPRQLVAAVALSLAVWLSAGLAALVLFPAFDLDPWTLAPWLLLVANSFALVIPSSPGTIGVYEASVQAALVAYGLSSSAALSFALVLHAINFFPVIAVGAIAWVWLRAREPR